MRRARAALTAAFASMMMALPTEVAALHWAPIPASSNTADYDPSADTWTTVGAMRSPRMGHVLVVLSSGDVLAVGGRQAYFDSNHYGGTYPLPAAVERYEPVTRSWAAGGQLVTPRWAHTATLLLNGEVLVAGGSIGDWVPVPIASVERYRPGTATSIGAAPMTIRRTGHTATLLPSGKVLVAGGRDAVTLASAELYDPVTDTWTPTGSLTTTRRSHAAMLLRNGKVLAFGGFSDTAHLTDAEIYDPATELWTPVGSTLAATDPLGYLGWLEAYARVDALVPVGSDGVLALSAENGQLYDSSAGRWSRAAAMTEARAGYTATAFAMNRVLVAGGFRSTGLRSALAYDAVAGTWAVASPLLLQTYAHSAVALPSGRVLVSGGIQTPVLAVSPSAAAVAPGTSTRICATGGVEGEAVYPPASLSWTVSTNASGATLAVEPTFSPWLPTTQCATYTAGVQCGGTVLQDIVTIDGRAASADVTVTVDPRGRTFFVVPAESDVLAGRSRQFTAACASAPVTWSISSSQTTGTGRSSIDPVTGTYTAGVNCGGWADWETISARAPSGEGATARVYAGKGSSPTDVLFVRPPGVSACETWEYNNTRPSYVAARGESVPLTVCDFYFSGRLSVSITANGSGASIDATTGRYVAGQHGGVDVVHVVDSCGATGEIQIVVDASLSPRTDETGTTGPSTGGGTPGTETAPAVTGGQRCATGSAEPLSLAIVLAAWIMQRRRIRPAL